MNDTTILVAEKATINKNIKLINVKTYHGNNTESIMFELHGLSYFASREWDKNDKTIRCDYGRDFPNEYYDTITTISGGTEGMNNQLVSCIFGKMPDKIYEAIRNLNI